MSIEIFKNYKVLKRYKVQLTLKMSLMHCLGSKNISVGFLNNWTM